MERGTAGNIAAAAAASGAGDSAGYPGEANSPSAPLTSRGDSRKLPDPMANTRSAAKQARAAVRRRARNRVQLASVRTSEKKIRALAKAGNADEATKLLSEFQSLIDRAAKKGVVHRNTASRHKQRVAALFPKKS